MTNNSIFGNDILIKIRQNDNGSVILSTYDRAHGHRGSFYIDADRMSRWMCSAEGSSFYDYDGGDFVRIYYNAARNRYEFIVVWLRNHGDGEVVGVRQQFSIGEFVLCGFQNLHDGITYLANTAEDPSPRIEFSETAQAIIGEYAQNKMMRNALVKAMRDNFCWPNTKWVRLYAEFNDFGFRDSDGMRGGLIASTFTIRGKDGKKYPKTTFNVHT